MQVFYTSRGRETNYNHLSGDIYTKVKSLNIKFKRKNSNKIHETQIEKQKSQRKVKLIKKHQNPNTESRIEPQSVVQEKI